MAIRRTPALLLVALGGCGSGEASQGGSPPTEAKSPAVFAPAEAASRRPLVRAGQPRRVVLSGRWYFRLDNDNVGVRQGYMRQRPLQGWRRVSVPYDWNGSDTRLNRSGVGWYRRDIRRPRAAKGTHWIVHFEGAGHTTTVYLNGRRIGGHVGSYLPFEVDLGGLRRRASRLVVRVSSLRTADDLTHWRGARFNGYGNGGWWNFGGIHREVVLRRARGLDILRAQALPRVSCPGCPARVQVRALIRNIGRRTVRPEVVARTAGQTVALAPVSIAPGGRAELAGDLTIEHPKLWDIGHGRLYRLDVSARAPTGAGAYRSWFGIRDVRKLADGRVMLNGRRLYVRGVSFHEDDPRVGSAWRARQLRAVLRRVDQLGVSVVRSHYPLHPGLLEKLDRRGVMVWDSAPINIVQNVRWKISSFRRAAIRVNEETVLRDRGHPSVLAYSVADELAIPVKAPQVRFLTQVAARVRALDPTRLVAVDRVARYGSPDDAHPVFGVFDALGINEYFGWYRGAYRPRPPAYTRDLPSYFDTLHRQQPGAALFVTEFGAEANRRGGLREKGTYAFQSNYLRRHIEAAASRPYLNGAIVWALRDFRVHSGWTGDNPRPNPPWNQKGILRADGSPKPAFREVQRIFARMARRARRRE